MPLVVEEQRPSACARATPRSRCGRAIDFWRPWRPADRAIASYPVTIDLTAAAKIELLAATHYLSPGRHRARRSFA
jgi:hypothetical protein